MRYRYRFDFLDGAVPDAPTRTEMTREMHGVVPAAEFDWDLGGATPAGINAIMDLDGRLPLEGVAVLTQALNTAFIFVEGWPSQMQSCVARQVGGAHAPPVAVARVVCSAMYAV